MLNVENVNDDKSFISVEIAVETVDISRDNSVEVYDERSDISTLML